MNTRPLWGMPYDNYCCVYAYSLHTVGIFIHNLYVMHINMHSLFLYWCNVHVFTYINQCAATDMF